MLMNQFLNGIKLQRSQIKVNNTTRSRSSKRVILRIDREITQEPWTQSARSFIFHRFFHLFGKSLESQWPAVYFCIVQRGSDWLPMTVILCSPGFKNTTLSEDAGPRWRTPLRER